MIQTIHGNVNPDDTAALRREMRKVAASLNAARLNLVAAPATAADPGNVNDVAFDATHFYVCVAANTWVRSALATW